MEAKPGPGTVLTTKEEQKLFQYILDMCDMGYGLTVEDARAVAFQIAEASGRKHPSVKKKLVVTGMQDFAATTHS